MRVYVYVCMWVWVCVGMVWWLALGLKTGFKAVGSATSSHVISRQSGKEPTPACLPAQGRMTSSAISGNNSICCGEPGLGLDDVEIYLVGHVRHGDGVCQLGSGVFLDCGGLIDKKRSGMAVSEVRGGAITDGWTDG